MRHQVAGFVAQHLKPGAWYKVRDEVHLVLRNPYRQDGDHHAGNKMALGNIRERLALHFDAEASLKSSITDDAYQVHIVIPYRKEAR